MVEFLCKLKKLIYRLGRIFNQINSRGTLALLLLLLLLFKLGGVSENFQLFQKN